MTPFELARDPVLQGVLRAALAWLLVAAALHKRRDPAAFREALAGYALLPQSALSRFARVLPGVEGLAAAALLAPLPAPAQALPALALLALYTSAIAAGLLRGRRGIDCGCGGPGGARPLGASLLVRNALLFGAALVCALPAHGRALCAVDAVSLAGGTLALGLLYATADRALALAPRLRALRRPA